MKTLATGKVVGNLDVLEPSCLLTLFIVRKYLSFLNILFQAIMCLTFLYLFGTRDLVIFFILFYNALNLCENNYDISLLPSDICSMSG